MYHCWHHIQQLQYGVLNHTHQLQERRHHTKCDGSIAQLQSAPYECQQIAQAEHATHHQAHHHRKLQSAHHIAAQPLLHRVQSVGHPLLAAQRSQHGIMLHTLLHLHLYAALVLPDVQRHLAQSACYQLACHDGQWRQQQQCPCQPSIKPSHQQEGAR